MELVALREWRGADEVKDGGDDGSGVDGFGDGSLEPGLESLLMD